MARMTRILTKAALVLLAATVPVGASAQAALEGKWAKHTGVSFWPDFHVTDDRAKIEWVVRGKRGDRIDLVARHERAGTVRANVTLS